MSCHQHKLPLEKSNRRFGTVWPGSPGTSRHSLNAMASIKLLEALSEEGHVTYNGFGHTVVLINPLPETIQGMLFLSILLRLCPEEMSSCIKDKKDYNSAFIKLELGVINENNVAKVHSPDA